LGIAADGKSTCGKNTCGKNTCERSQVILKTIEKSRSKNIFSDINASKANFDEIYVMDDPRAYFSVLGALDYMIPDIAEPVVRQILAAKAKIDGTDLVVLDVGCSYGINAAVHRFPLNFDTLRWRYAHREMSALSAEEMTRLDRHYFAAWPDIGLARFVGLDISEPAVRYAEAVGLIDDGIVADLETESLTPEQAQIAGSANVLLSTGCIGYVTEKTFRKLLDVTEPAPWVISFVLRMFPYEPLAAAFSEHGLVTERLQGATFVQRRFRDPDEFERAIATLEEHGIDTAGFESEGLFQAELFLSRPEADARALPLEEIVTVTSGRHKTVGPRYVQVKTDEGMQIAVEP
jgi:SAM-dependent methyltransferase